MGDIGCLDRLAGQRHAAGHGEHQRDAQHQ